MLLPTWRHFIRCLRLMDTTEGRLLLLRAIIDATPSYDADATLLDAAATFRCYAYKFRSACLIERYFDDAFFAIRATLYATARAHFARAPLRQITMPDDADIAYAAPPRAAADAAAR